MSPPVLRRALLALAVVMSAAAHGDGAASEALEAARTRWEAAALLDYDYGYQKYCECYGATPPETVVTVRGGAVTRVRHRRPDNPAEVPAEDRNVQYYWTVAELFGLLESALERGATVRAEYDAALGYPTSLYVDYDADFVGDELDLRLTRVEPLAR